MSLASLVAAAAAVTPSATRPWNSSSSSSGGGNFPVSRGVCSQGSRLVQASGGGKSPGVISNRCRGRHVLGSSILGVSRLDGGLRERNENEGGGEGGVRVHVGRNSRGAIFNLAEGGVSLSSPILGVSRLDGVLRDRRSRLEGGEGVVLKTKTRARARTRTRNVGLEARASSSVQDVVVGVMEAVKAGWTANPPTWEASFVAMGSICVVGAPLLFVGLTKSGIASAYLLGSVIWRAYGGQGLATIMLFYLIMGLGRCSKKCSKRKASISSISSSSSSSSALGTAATKLKMKDKQKEGIAEKRSGRRGVGSVVGSGTAAAVCALCSIYGIGGPDIAHLWQLGYLASLCTKLSDTISSEIGKAYGKTTYLVTTLSVVPRGTEGAVSVEGTVAGVVAAIFLAAAAFALGQVDQCGAIIAVSASQLANLFESFLGATLQGRPGYEWLSNDIVNVANVTVGAGLAILLGKYMGSGV